MMQINWIPILIGIWGSKSYYMETKTTTTNDSVVRGTEQETHTALTITFGMYCELNIISQCTHIVFIYIQIKCTLFQCAEVWA